MVELVSRFDLTEGVSKLDVAGCCLVRSVGANFSCVDDFVTDFFSFAITCSSVTANTCSSVIADTCSSVIADICSSLIVNTLAVCLVFMFY